MNGSQLRQWRKLLNYTQEQAGNEFGVTRATIQNWEYEITAVPVAVELASHQLLRQWRRRLEFGPVTLIYANAPLWSPSSVDQLPTLFCKRCLNNKAAFIKVIEFKYSSEYFNPMILDQFGLIVWSGLELIEVCNKLG